MARRAFLMIFLMTLAVAAAIAAYAHWPPPKLPADARVDRIVVLKQARVLQLLSGDEVIAQYTVSLGTNPIGHKQQEGDRRTPEGSYVIDWRKPDSAFHRALHVSYPNAADRRQAAARGVSPGGLIMIHGLPNGRGLIGRWHRLEDWTHGCIAVTNAEIEDLWRVVRDGTPIDIRP